MSAVKAFCVIPLVVLSCQTVLAQFEPHLTLTSLLPDGSDEQFGLSVAVSEDAIVVGDMQTFAGHAAMGAAYVFDAKTGQLRFPLVPSFVEGRDRVVQFGGDLAVFGDRAIVGARKSVFESAGRGAAYIFDTITGEELRLLRPDELDVDGTGWNDVAFSAQTDRAELKVNRTRRPEFVRK